MTTRMTAGSEQSAPSPAAMPRPRSTYRLQITAAFTLFDAARWVAYLHSLGVDWLYVSPLLAAEPGSDHGYDVIDHSRTDAARGGRAGLAALADAAHAHGMGILADIVPNHVGVASPLLSVWWRDVLTHGPESKYATAFDIDWAAGGGQIVIPVLGDGADELAALTLDDGQLRYHEHAFPLAPGSAQAGASARAVHARQHYRLVNFRRADTELNYRRFFAVNSLAAIRVEDPSVFAESHAEIRHWFDAGWVDGLRVDHPDGLRDPTGYLRHLAALSGGRYTVVEKILEPGESLPADWVCDGTTGYEALALIDRVLIDPAGRSALDKLDAELRGAPANWTEIVHASKRAVADGILSSEVRRLARLLRSGEATPSDAEIDAVSELLANFTVYRTYQPESDPELPRALGRSKDRRPELAEPFDVIEAAATDPESEFAIRLQQTSGAVMAKGVEDGACYRFPRLTSLTEVGGDPSSFAVSVEEFHAEQQRRLAAWPGTMTTLSTHDTKRGEDVRSRIDVLAEIPGEWGQLVRSIVALVKFPDGVLGNLLLQAIVGTWPIARNRLQTYAKKAAREAGESTGWIDPDPAFESAVRVLVDACFDDSAIAAAVGALAWEVRGAGWSNSLAAKLIQLTAPGAPDVYRGTELWSTDLVDPDNRRPFNALAPGGAAELLARLDGGWLPAVDETGAAKLLVTSRALRLRRDRAALFTGYAPVTAIGPGAQHVLAFDRGGVVTVATRLPIGLARRGGWGETALMVPPGLWRDELTGRVVGDGAVPVTLPVADVLHRYPVALLVAQGLGRV